MRTLKPTAEAHRHTGGTTQYTQESSFTVLSRFFGGNLPDYGASVFVHKR